MSTSDTATLVLAVVLTAIFAAHGFNQPSWVSTYTTLMRYRVAVLLHVLLNVAFFLLLLLVLQRLGRVVHSEWMPLWISSGWIPRKFPEGAPVWGAFIATVVLSTAATFSNRVRRRIHALAGIPDKAREFASALADSSMQVDSEVRAKVSAMLQSVGLGPSSEWLPHAQPLHDQINQAGWLFVQVRDWETDPAFRGFVDEARNELFRLRQRFDALSLRVSRMLASFEILAMVKHEFHKHSAEGEQLDGHLRRLTGDMIADACEDVSLFHRDACLLAARGILATESTRSGRAFAFDRLGFKDVVPERSSIYRVFPFAAGLLFVGLWILFLTQEVPRRDLTPFQLQLVIMVTNLGALAIAILPKPHFGFANGGLYRRTPWGFMLASSIAAALFFVIVNLVAGGVLSTVERRFHNGGPYFAFAVLTAATTVWLMQDHRWLGLRSRVLRRLCDAAVFGIAWLAAGAIANALTLLANHQSLGHLADGRTVGALLSMLVFGALMGALIPEYVRRRPDLEVEADVMHMPEWLRWPRMEQVPQPIRLEKT